MKIKLWGTRGSIPTPYSPETVETRTRALFEKFFNDGYSQKTDLDTFFSMVPRYKYGGWGGNTACVEVTHGPENKENKENKQSRVIIDGGSGIRNVNASKGEFHIFFTHFHWDHIIGLPFFTPLYIPGNKIHFYAVQPELQQMMKTLFQKPFFPVPLEGLSASIEYHALKPREKVSVGEISLTPYMMDHPDPCWGYRIEHGGKSVAYCVDTEATRLSREQLGADLAMYQNLDLMIFDSQYTLAEAIEKMNWGHAAAVLGIDLAVREKIKQIAFVHHDPMASDQKIAEAEQQARDYYLSLKSSNKSIENIKWDFAREGDEYIF